MLRGDGPEFWDSMTAYPFTWGVWSTADTTVFGAVLQIYATTQQ